MESLNNYFYERWRGDPMFLYFLRFAVSRRCVVEYVLCDVYAMMCM